MRRASLRVGGFDRDGPRAAVGAQPGGAHLAVDSGQRGGDAVVAQGFGQTIDTVALGDGVEIERNGSPFAHELAVDIQHLMRGAPGRGHGGADRPSLGGVGSEAPGAHGIAHADVKSAARGAADLQPQPQHFGQPGRDGEPFIQRGAVQLHQRAVGLPGGHLCVHLIHGGLQRRAQRVRIEAGRGVERGLPARAHGRTVEGMADRIRRRLRHSVPRLSAPRASDPPGQGYRSMQPSRPPPSRARHKP